MKRVILVTGATSPVGQYLCKHYDQKENMLLLHGRDAAKLRVVSKPLIAERYMLAANLAEIATVADSFKQLPRAVDHIDLLILNAFPKLESPLRDCEPAELATHFQVLAGNAEVIRQALPLLQKSSSPNILNIVADWGVPMHNIMTGPAPYISAKYAMYGLGVALQTEIASCGIRITNLCPGVIDTKSPDGKSTPEGIPLADIARAVDFVVGQRNSVVKTIVLSPTKPDYNGL